MKLRTSLLLGMAGSLVILLAACTSNRGPIVALALLDQTLHVVVKPSKTVVKVGEVIPTELRVENPTSSPEVVKVMTCGWDEQWQSTSQAVDYGWNCAWNFPVAITIPPGGADVRDLDLHVRGPVAGGHVTFKMGFTPFGTTSTYWSDDITLSVTP